MNEEPSTRPVEIEGRPLREWLGDEPAVSTGAWSLGVASERIVAPPDDGARSEPVPSANSNGRDFATPGPQVIKLPDRAPVHAPGIRLGRRSLRPAAQWEGVVEER